MPTTRRATMATSSHIWVTPSVQALRPPLVPIPARFAANIPRRSDVEHMTHRPGRRAGQAAELGSGGADEVGDDCAELLAGVLLQEVARTLDNGVIQSGRARHCALQYGRHGPGDRVRVAERDEEWLVPGREL